MSKFPDHDAQDPGKILAPVQGKVRNAPRADGWGNRVTLNKYELTRLGKDAMREHHYDEAKKHFHGVLKINRRDIIALNYLGCIALEQRDYDEAEKRFKEILSVKPNDEIAPLYLIRVTLSKGRILDAIEMVRGRLEQGMHLPTLCIAKLIAEQGIGGKEWRQSYDVMLGVAKSHGLLSQDQAGFFKRSGTGKEYYGRITPEFFRGVDASIRRFASSSAFVLGESLAPQESHTEKLRDESVIPATPTGHARG